MKYNMIDLNANEGVIESVIDSASGKVVIVSSNSLVISSIIEHLKGPSELGGFELYNGLLQVNTGVESDVKVVATSLDRLTKELPKVVDNEYKVAVIERENENSLSFNIVLKDINEMVGINLPTVDEVQTTKKKTSKWDKDGILASIRENNVVFVQDVNKSVVDIIRQGKANTTVLKNISEFEDTYVLSGRNGVLVFEFSAPEEGKIGYPDALFFISTAIRNGINIVCDTSWIGLLLNLTFVHDDIDMSSIVIHNTTDYGVMGNIGLYTKEEMNI